LRELLLLQWRLRMLAAAARNTQKGMVLQRRLEQQRLET
jgi:hypothetical protein